MGIAPAFAAPGDLKLALFSPSPSLDDRFGRSVATVADKIVVGADFVNTVGEAYLFDGGSGSLLQTFANPTPETGDQFGFAVASLGDNVLVGALLDDTGAPNAGAVYLFDTSNGNLLQTYQKPNPTFGDLFGASVAAIGSNILVGATTDDVAANNAGAAYVVDSATGAILQTFPNPTAEADGLFARSVASVGNNALVGARKDDTGANDAGAAYLLDSATGDVIRTFLNPTPANFDEFGHSLAVLENNTVVIGAWQDDTGARDAGAAYLFDIETGDLLQTFLNPTPDERDNFGWSVTGVGNDVLIGAWRDDTVGTDAGAAYLFDGETGELLMTLFSPYPNDGAQFGHSVAALGIDLLVSADLDDTAAVNSGAVYLFEGVPEPSTCLLVVFGLAGFAIFARCRGR